MWPVKVLMVAPKGFNILYNINPHMVGDDGKLNTVNVNTAWTQWENLKQVFEQQNMQVSVLEGDPEFPDMVFCANPFFPFIKENKPALLLSNMNSTYRKHEPLFYTDWAEQNHIEVYQLKSNLSFEGMGDALWNYDTQEVFGGYGFRTEKAAYDEVESIIEKPVHRLKLIDENFYHLDTCLSIIDGNTALYVHEAFSPESYELLVSKFKNLFRISYLEAVSGFAVNSCSVNGKDVIVPNQCPQTTQTLSAHGFQVHNVDTSEFIKAGGSVFCMKMLYW